MAVAVQHMENDFRLTQKQVQAQRILTQDATHVCLEGGSRSGKTFLLVRAIIYRAWKAANSDHAIFRFRHNSVIKHVVHGTLQDVFKKCFPEKWQESAGFTRLPVKYHGAPLDYLEFDNGSRIWFSGLDDKERVEKILGAEFATLYFNECSQIPYYSRNVVISRLAQKTALKNRAYYDLNPDDTSSWIYELFHNKREPITKVKTNRPHNYALYRINPEDNRENLDQEYLSNLEELPERERKRFLYGEYADSAKGALWTEEMIIATRVVDVPEMRRIVVGVDPSGHDGDQSSGNDEVGIIVGGIGIDGHGYLLEDVSGPMGPREWGKMVVQTYRNHQADLVVGEQNYGGAMIEHTIRAYDVDDPEYGSTDVEVNYRNVVASRGKVVRAEPISGLYDQGRIHHVGRFPKLEAEMTSMTQEGYKGVGSPNRVDAMVWVFTALFAGLTRKEQNEFTNVPQVHHQPRSAAQFSRRRHF